MIITIVGVGLIGGSMGLSLKENGFAREIIGVGRRESSLDKAIELGLIDKKETLHEAVVVADLIVLAVPVSTLTTLLPEVMDLISEKQVVIDVGSTKEKFLQRIKDHPKRGRFVATHPMAGTEYSGPEAAQKGLFTGKNTVFCDVEDSDADALELVKRLYGSLGMHILCMDAVSHDLHTAYVSHISHITSFALALTVLEKEKEDSHIFELASGGFASTVRLAKSSPEMWAPIFMQNKHNVLDVLYEMIFQLKKMKQMLIDEDEEGFYKLIKEANKIQKIIE